MKYAMLCITDKDFLLNKKTVVTLGKFDGIHRGHKKLIDEARRIADEKGYLLVVFTFKVAPDCKFDYMSGDVINTMPEREFLFEKRGVDILVEYPFDEETANMPPLDFLESVLKNRLNAQSVVVGTDWTFGKMGEGNSDLLKASQKLFDFSAVVIDKETYEGREISSTYIKEELNAGNMETVNILLGYPYTIVGQVVHGKELGRTIQVPTINIELDADKIVPPYGVYSSKIILDGTEYYGVSNIGIKPTVGEDNKLCIETHIFNFNENIYDRTVEIQLFHFERPEMKFNDIDALKNQLNRDIEFTKSYFMLDL